MLVISQSNAKTLVKDLFTHSDCKVLIKTSEKFHAGCNCRLMEVHGVSDEKRTKRIITRANEMSNTVLCMSVFARLGLLITVMVKFTY